MNKISVSKKYQFSGHRNGVYCLEHSTLPNKFFSAAADGMVVEWDLNNPDQGRLVAKLNNSIFALHLWAERDLLLLGHNYDGLHVLDFKNKQEKGSLNFTKANIFDIAVCNQEAWVACGDGTVVTVSLADLKVTDKIKKSSDRARSIAVDEHRKLIAVGYSDNRIRIFSEDRKEIAELEGHLNSVFTIKMSPDGRYLISCGRDARIRIWDAEKNYELVHEIVGHMYTINHLDFSPDGKYFVTCSMDKSIKIWDLNQFKLLKVIDKGRHAGHGTSVNRLLWTTHNNWLISASDDHSIAVWEIKF